MYRKLRNLGVFLAASGAGILLMTMGSQVNADYQASIIGIVQQSGGQFDRNRDDYDILMQAITDAGLVNELDDVTADLTLFAPTDRSFIRLAQDLGYTGSDEEGAYSAILDKLTIQGEGDPTPLLTELLQYHIGDGAQSLKEIKRSDEIKTLGGGRIVPYLNHLLDAEPDLKNPRFNIFNSDIDATNGIIHSIDRVLLPVDLANTPEDVGSIAAIVAQNGGELDRNTLDYDVLLNALIATDLVTTLDDPTADITVFAPRDIAFIRLAQGLGYTGSNETGAFQYIVDTLTELGDGDPIPQLQSILLYHLSPTTQVAKDVILSESIETALEDASFHPDGFSPEQNIPALRDPRLSILQSDIRASNGTIHTINRVLLPIEIGQKYSIWKRSI